MKKVIVILAAVTLALLFCLSAGASSLQVSIVPSDALWMLHLDMEKYASSQLYKLLTDKGGAAGINNEAGKFFEKFKIEPFKDIKGITIYGRGKDEEDAVVAISGNFDKAYLLGLIKAEATQKELPYGKHTIYNWDNSEFGVFATDTLILLAEREQSLKSALDAMEGKIGNISSSPLMAQIKKESADAIVVGAAADISGILGEHEKSAILGKMRTAACSITEKGEVFSLKLDIGAESAQVAKELEQAIRGLIAIGNLQLAETTELKTLLQDINVALDGEKVRIVLAYPIAKLFDILKKQEVLPHGSLGALLPQSLY